MKVISFEDIKRLDINKEYFYNWAKETFLCKEKCLLPPKTSIKYYDGEGFVNIMPSIIPDLGIYGVKVVSRNPNSIPTLKSNIMLFDITSNELLSVMDADYITAFRTGATAVLTIEALAKKDFSTIAFIGLGNICRAVSLILFNHFFNRDLTVKLFLYKNTDNGLIKLLSQFKKIKIETYDNLKETIAGSDVVVSCVTYAENDLAKPEWFKKGALLIPIHTRGFLNCDLEFDRIVVDDKEHVKGFKNYSSFKNLCELSDVLKNNKFGRNNDDERIIAYNIGISILDVFFAKKIFDLFETHDDINISPIGTNKYWVE